MSGTQPFYFGSLAKAQYVPAPNTDMDASHVGQAEQLDYFNGGAYVAEGFGTHREFSMNWGIQEKSAMDFLRDYRSGINGKGLLYFVDPFAVNCMPPFWARPELTARGGPSLVDPYNKPTAAPGATVVNYATNPGFRTGAGTAVVRQNIVYNPRLSAGTGWSVLSGAITLTDRGWNFSQAAGGGNQGAFGSNAVALAALPNMPYTLSVDVTSTTPIVLRLAIAWLTAARGSISEPMTVINIPTAGAGRYSTTLTSPATTAFARVTILTTDTGSAVTGTVRNILLEQSTLSLPYFDGASGSDATFTYGWAGAVNATASQAVATVPATVNVAAGQTIGYRIADSTAQGGFAWRSQLLMTGNMGINFAAAQPVVTNQLFTILMRVRASRSLRVRPRIYGTQTAADITVPANEWTWVRGQATVPNTSSNVNGILLGGAHGGFADDTLDIDRALIVEGNYTGPYFDGETEFVTGEESWWNGVAEASTSTLPATLGSLPNLGALYTIKTAPDAVPQRSLVLLIPEDRDLWVGFTGSATNGGVIRIQPINREGSFGVLTDATLLSPMGDVRLNHKFPGAQYRAIKVYFTSTLAGTSTINLVSSKGVYTAPGETPVLTGGHSEGEGHTGFRFSNDGVTMAYVQAADGHRYVTTAASFTEMGAWA